MDPKRTTTSLPSGMNVRILTPVSRGGNIYGIDAEEVSKHTGLPLEDYKRISDWASFNDALFYIKKTHLFSMDEAAQQAAAMNLPRVVLYKLEPTPEELDKHNRRQQKLAEEKKKKEQPPPPPPPAPTTVKDKEEKPQKKKKASSKSKKSKE